MAWRNCIQSAIGQIPQLIMSDATVQEYLTAINNATTSSQRTAVFNTYIKPLLANTYVLNADITEGLILGTSGNHVNLEIEGSFKNAVTYYNGSVYSDYSKTASGTSGNGSAFIAFIDDDLQLGYFDIFNMNISNPLNCSRWAGTVPATSGATAQVFYTILSGNEYHQYDWQSVQSISGKNKTVSLTTLKEESINDGIPVDDATESAFNNAPNSCSVGGIVSVDLPIIDDNPLSIAVKYNIPELTDSVYTSCKVVAKKNKIPKSKTDGDKILDVSPSSHGCVITGLEQETKYYVVVFVEDSFGNKAESEPGGPVRTGKQDGIFIDKVSVIQATIDSDGIKDSVSVSQV